MRSARARATQSRTAVSVRSRSRATAPTVLPSSSTRRTTPALNSSVNWRRARRVFGVSAIAVDIVSPVGKVSTESDHAQWKELRSNGQFSIITVVIASTLLVRSSATLSGLLVGLCLFHCGLVVVALARGGARPPVPIDALVIRPFAWLGSFNYALYLCTIPYYERAPRLPESVTALT